MKLWVRVRQLEREEQREREENEKLLEGGQTGGGSATNEAVGESQVVRERRIEREREEKEKLLKGGKAGDGSATSEGVALRHAAQYMMYAC